VELAGFGYGALLWRSGKALWSRTFPSAIRFIGVRFATFSASLKVLFPCAKNWQLCRTESGRRHMRKFLEIGGQTREGELKIQELNGLLGGRAK
jgi:hypothetical protein